MLLISIVASISAGDFLNNWTEALKDKGSINAPYEIAANVLVPNPTGKQSNVNIDYPSLPNVEQGGYKAVGRFGDTTDEYKDYGDFTTTQPGFGGLIRGQMDFVPGGIPASATFNREESLKAYPEQMQGIPEGNMPVFRHW